MTTRDDNKLSLKINNPFIRKVNMETKNKINHLFKFETRKGMKLPNGHTLEDSGGTWKPVIIRADPKYSSDDVSKEVKRFGEEEGFVKGVDGKPFVCAFFLFYDRTISNDEIPETFSKWGGEVGNHLVDFPEDGNFIAKYS